MLITYHRKRSDDYRVTMIHTKPLKKKLPNVDFRKYRHGDTYNTEEAACAHGWEYIEDRIANDFEEYRESELNAV